MADFCILSLKFQLIDSSFCYFGRRKDHNSTLVVVQYIPLVIAAGVVCFPHAHRVMREVDIAVVACLGSAFAYVRKGVVGMLKGISYKRKSEGGRPTEEYEVVSLIAKRGGWG